MTPDLHEQLLEAARVLFLQHGYRAGVDAIAGAAGVSKQTLYNHFGSKEALFAEVMGSCSRRLTVPLADSEGDLRGALTGFARSFRETVLAPEGLALHRMLVGEMPRFPEAAQQVFAGGPALLHAQLAAVLARAMANGRLRSADPRFAASAFLSLLAGFERDSLLYGCPIHAGEPERAEALVDLFLHAYAPPEGMETAKSAKCAKGIEGEIR